MIIPRVQEQAPAEDTEDDLGNVPAEERLLVEQLRKLGRPVHVRDLERTFTRHTLERLGGWRSITDLLETLVESGKVIRTRKKTYGLPEAMSLVRGRFQASAAGFGFVVPDSNGGKAGGDQSALKAPARDPRGLLQGNDAKAKVFGDEVARLVAMARRRGMGCAGQERRGQPKKGRDGKRKQGRADRHALS